MTEWLIPETPNLPPEFIQAVQQHTDGLAGRYAATLLWQRGVQSLRDLPGYLDPSQYLPSSPWEFGQELDWAIDRLLQAQQNAEKVLIWGDFDADGITATAVLWEGLGQFFNQPDQLSYYIPDRLTESHGLSVTKIDEFHHQGYQLIVTCDTGSSNVVELAHAQTLNLDVIVTDHHTLPPQRPPVTAILNPRYLPAQHPMRSLSGVAVAYKLVEALYQQAPSAPTQPLASLLDLVAIGLIADLVELTGESRYLAQRGLATLQTLSLPKGKPLTESRRPGITRLLELCQRTGDRPSDVAFGLGPRINAVSRIHGDARFCVELLTSREVKRCQHLAEQTELANARRKALQKDLVRQVRQRLQMTDLSTTRVIVLGDPQWPVGILGLVAGQIAQEYGLPTILLQIGLPFEQAGQSNEESLLGSDIQPVLARGSARSVHQIDLYQLVQAQAHLLHRFGGHPLALGLSLPVENLPLFISGVDRQLKQHYADFWMGSGHRIEVDLVVTVAELGKFLFKELKLLEPFGMGNPLPKLLIRNAWFERSRNQNIKDWRGKKVRYIKTEFELWDQSCDRGFPGTWWEHYVDELPKGRCDVIVELDFNTHNREYEVRLIAVRSTETSPTSGDPPPWAVSVSNSHCQILDWRNQTVSSVPTDVPASPLPATSQEREPEQLLVLKDCPHSWDDLQTWLKRANQADQTLALAYQWSDSDLAQPHQIWQQLVGIAKFLSRTGKLVDRHQICQKLSITDATLTLGLALLPALGFRVICPDHRVQIFHSVPPETESGYQLHQGLAPQWNAFLSAIQEERFRQHYFVHVPLPIIQAITRHGEPGDQVNP